MSELTQTGNHGLEKSIVKYFLGVAEKKASFRKVDVVNAVPDLKNYNKKFTEIFNNANYHLIRVFGFKIQEVMVKNAKVFIVVPKQIISESIVPTRKHPEMSLLYLILAYLFMKGDKVSEVLLWGFLKKVDIDVEDLQHDYYGNVKKLITETFVKQLYLIREKVVEEGGTDFSFYYSWGPRGNHEVSKKEILDYVAELLKRPNKCFLQQYKEVYDRNPHESTQAGPSQATPKNTPKN